MNIFGPPLIRAFLFCLLLLCSFPAQAYCAELHLDGSQLNIYWIIPFACILLCIALCPLLVPHFWHKHFGKVALFWATTILVAFFVKFGWKLTLYEFLHTMLLEYIPFLVLLFALFTVAGGIRLTGSLVGTPLVNAGLLFAGAACASLMGTTGAAMLFIRPLLRANAHRRYRVHTAVFFIFLVANIGGSLTPLGDPPLFLGFLKGVSFFWTLEHMFIPMAFLTICLLAIYLIADIILYKKEGSPTPAEKSDEKIGLDGVINFPLLLAIVGCVLASGIWKTDLAIPIFGGLELALPNVARDIALFGIAGASLALTRRETRDLNDFNWGPIAEVAKLFFGIFICMLPAIAILQAGDKGALKEIINLVTVNGQPDNRMYFWLTGLLSSFLDNAPTYVVFFNTAGGDPVHLMTDMASTLFAISAGAVFMGANTYIGNAPNFMVRAIAEDNGVRMPSFFGYMLWSGAILVPLFVILTFIFIR